MSGVMDHVNVNLKIDSLLMAALDLSTSHDHLLLTVAGTLSNGTGSGQASQHWHDTRTLTASATEDLDFAAALTNAFGVSLTFAKAKLVFFRAATTNTNSVVVTRPASNGVTLFLAAGDGISLAAGEWFLYFSPTVGKTVTAATADLVTVTNSAGSTSVVYDVIVVGTD